MYIALPHNVIELHNTQTKFNRKHKLPDQHPKFNRQGKTIKWETQAPLEAVTITQKAKQKTMYTADERKEQSITQYKIH